MIVINFLSFAVAFLSIFGFIKFLRSYITWRTSPLWSVPGPSRGSFTLGQFTTIRREPFLAPVKRWWKEAGVDVPFIHYSVYFGQEVLQVFDADVVKDILFSNYGQKPRFRKNLYGLIPILGNGLVTLEGRDWQRHRRIVHPSFQPRLIRESLGDFVPKIISKFIKHWENADGKEIDIATHMSNLTLDIFGVVAFSHNFQALECIERWANQRDDKNYDMIDPVNDKIMMSMGEMIQNTRRRILLQNLNLSILDFPTKRCRKIMNAAVDEVVSEARRKLKMNESSSSDYQSNEHERGSIKDGDHSRISLLQRLLNAENSPSKKLTRNSLENHELRDETLTFLMAGHDTTAGWCYWAFFALCKYPDVQEKVFQDINKHAPKGKDSVITIDMIEKMSYFVAFMKEVLRVYPPVGIIIRYNVNEENLKGVKVPVGTRIIIPIHLLHRHPKYWKDPDEFRPERWLGKEHPSSHKYAYMPFSNGPRNCIGQFFAEVEAKLMMAPLIRSFSFRMAPSMRDCDFTFILSIIMRAKPGLKVIASKRK